MTTRMSVALCTYNGAEYVEEQLQSLGHQTRLPDELVVCDDVSTDSTVEIAEAFATRAPFPVKVVRNPSNLGPNANFAQAMSLCSGDVIFLCDQDDVWRDHKLQAYEQIFETHPSIAAVYSDAELIDDAGKPMNLGLWDALGYSLSMREEFRRSAFELLSRVTVVTGATLAVRKTYVPLLVPIDEGWVHDAWIAFLLSAVSEIYMEDRPSIYYRIHAGQHVGVGPLRNPALKPPSRFARMNLLRRLRQPTRDELAQGIQHHRAALERLRARRDEYPVDDAQLRSIADSVEHFIFRAGLAPGKPRVAAVVREARTGRYGRFSSGWTSIVKDLLLAERLVRGPHPQADP